MAERIEPAEAARFLRALATISGAVFRDAMTQRLETLAEEASRDLVDGQDTGSLLGAWCGALFNRALRVVHNPALTRGHLHALWHVVGYAKDKDLQAELVPLAKAWRSATTVPARAAARLDLLAWMKGNERAIAHAMMGPFRAPDVRGQPVH